MEKLFEASANLVFSTDISFKRYLFEQINWSDRLIAITGARGSGKTTLLLQYIKDKLGNSPETLYISLDDIYFANHSLIDLADVFEKNGGKNLIIDEVHKYKNWSREIKNIYDRYKNLKVVFTGSSALEIHKAESDLSRRAIPYYLHNMSFREYIELIYQIKLPVLSISEIVLNHTEITTHLIDKIKPLKVFKEYIQKGAYPFIKESSSKYFERLKSIINLIIEVDLPAVLSIEYQSVYKLKKMLALIANSVPFKPNISELSRKIMTSRDNLLLYLSYLERAGIIKNLKSESSPGGYLTKPEKIYLQNTALINALNNDNENNGNIRETFFLNQLSVNHTIKASKKGDFIVDGKYIFEIGGKHKNRKQIAGIADSYIVSDSIEHGFLNKIPLYLFGFLY